MRMNLKHLLCCTVIAGLPLQAFADLVDSPPPADVAVVDFSTQTTVSDAVTGPIQIGDLVGLDITASTILPDPGLFTNYPDWGLCTNGDWWSPKTYISSQGAQGIRFSFNDGPVSFVGGFMNHARGCAGNPDLVISALDENMNVLESYSITDIITPDGYNEGAFRGISRPSADIAYFEVTGESPALDDLTFSTSSSVPPTPVPALPLFGLLTLGGLVGLFGLRKLKQ